jgi:DNA polymerase-3 subunit delta'
MLALLGSLPELDIPAVYDFADRLGRSSEDAAANLRTAFDLLSDCVARVIRYAATRQPAGELAAGEAQLIARMAARGLDPWLPVWEKLNRLPAAAEGLNLDRRLVLLDAFLAVAKGAGA